MADVNPRTIFVTVGTTLFDSLIECVSDINFLMGMHERNFRKIVIQFGNGAWPSFVQTQSLRDNQNDAISSGVFNLPSNDRMTIQWEAYRFKPSLEKDMKDAHLVISHAGAGSIMEGLSICREANMDVTKDAMVMKKLAVVINDKLMHNHQTELAEALEKRGYLFVLSSPQQLLSEDVRARMNSFIPRPFSGGDPMAFAQLLNTYLELET